MRVTRMLAMHGDDAGEVLDALLDADEGRSSGS